MTIRTLNLSKKKMLFILLMLVWADIGVTYMGLLKLKQHDPINWMNTEVSMSVGPMIRNLGLEPGLLIGGIVNSFVILAIAILFPIEFTHGVLTGIFVLALAINLRLMFML
jgi:hypothetical protein